VGRLWVELLRSDSASLVLGVRVNVWMSLLVGLLAVAALIRLHRRPLPATPYPSPDTATEFGVGSVPVVAETAEVEVEVDEREIGASDSGAAGPDDGAGGAGA
jgi:hypothetical protein